MLYRPQVSRSARIAIRLPAILSIVGVAVGCDDGAARCDGTCVADPAPHCLRDELVAGDCLGGLVRGPAAAAGTVCAGPAGATACRWRPPPIEGIDPRALIDGFDTEPMEMHVAPAPDLAFAWTAPSGAAFVACAIFTCAPAFARREPDEPATSQTALVRIANAGACILALQATSASPSSLPIGERSQPIAQDACVATRAYDRVIDFVAAGCWAYDSTAIIAASRLAPLRVEDVAAVAPEVPARASCTRDGDACYDDAHAHPFFGACLAGVCQPRCASPEDCEIAGARLLGRAPEPACPWECRELPSSLVGVCAPLVR